MVLARPGELPRAMSIKIFLFSFFHPSYFPGGIFAKYELGQPPQKRYECVCVHALRVCAIGSASANITRTHTHGVPASPRPQRPLPSNAAPMLWHARVQALGAECPAEAHFARCSTDWAAVAGVLVGVSSGSCGCRTTPTTFTGSSWGW